MMLQFFSSINKILLENHQYPYAASFEHIKPTLNKYGEFWYAACTFQETRRLQGQTLFDKFHASKSDNWACAYVDKSDNRAGEYPLGHDPPAEVSTLWFQNTNLPNVKLSKKCFYLFSINNNCLDGRLFHEFANLVHLLCKSDIPCNLR